MAGGVAAASLRTFWLKTFPMRLRDLSIERKFFLVILSVCLAPAVVFTTLAIKATMLTHEETMGGELEKQTELIVERFDNFLTGRAQRLRLALRRLTGERQGPPDPSPALQELKAGALADVAVFVREPGRRETSVYAPESETARLLNQIDPARFDEWLELPAPPARGGFADLRVSVLGRLEPFTVAALVMALPDGGIAVFLVSADDLIRQFRQSLPVPPDFLVVLSNNEAVVNSSSMLPDESRTFLTRHAAEARGEREWFRHEVLGHPYLFAMASSNELKRRQAEWGGGSSWQFMVTHDLESFLGPRDRMIWLTVLVALGLVLVLMVVAAVLSRAIVRPLRELKYQAGRLAQGRLDVRASSDSRDEIGDLADTFNSMAAQLQKTYRELERRVDENRLRAEHINVINEITHANLQAQELETIFQNLRRDLGRIVAYDALWLAHLDGSSSDLAVVEVFPGRLITLLKDGRIPLVNSLHGTAIDHEETLHAEIGPHQRGDWFETRAFAGEGYQSYLIAPLLSRQGVIGVLGIASISPDAFNRDLVDIMTSVAGAVSIALEQSESFHQLSQFAQELERKVMDRTTELEKTRLKLSQTEKYFALGRLASNLAHEINNPLGIIKNYLELAKSNLIKVGGGRRQSDPNLDHLRIINEEVDRIAKLVRKLMDLHRPTEQSVQAVDVNKVIEEILALLEENLKGQGIVVERRLDAGLRRPVASPDLIRQVLINLIRNAQDAMESGGRLTVETGMESSSGNGGRALCIRISDTGCGIPPEHLSQVFDPFFTTKSQEKGTGLGLCVSYSIVHLYQGAIDISSQPGEGTTVSVTLPLERPQPTQTAVEIQPV
jgi:signal transduction histidine kinase